MPAASLSAIIPVYNRRELVLRAISSVLEQDADIAREIIVVDDGSSDGTADAVRERFGEDARVRLIASAHRGASAARNVGSRQATGEFITFLDSDDYWLPGTLALILRVFAHLPRAAFVCVDGATVATPAQPAQARIVAGNAPGWSRAQFQRAALVRERIGAPDPLDLLHGDFFPAIVFGDLFYLSGMIMRRESVAAAGPFNERFHFFNDWEFFARLCLVGEGAYLAGDGFRRDTGRPDQISRRRPATALARRHLYIVRSQMRRAQNRAHAQTIRIALADACYGMARALRSSTHRRWALRYLRYCVAHRYKFFRALALLLASRG